MRKSVRILLLPAVVALVFAGAAPAGATEQVVLDQGHVDVIGVAFEDGALNLHVHDEEADVEYAPHEVVLVAKPGARTAVPDDPAFAFLGAPGDPVWVLPEIQDPELLWPGFGLEEVDSGIFVDDTVRVSLLAAYGPGDFSIFTVGTAGPTILADTGDGLPDSIDLPAGAHLHANWAFEGAGDYVFLVRASGRLASTGETVRSNFGLYHFKVLS